jgi:AbiV family abortive infection protein
MGWRAQGDTGMGKLDWYKERLTPEQAAEGMNAATANAMRLVDDARILLDAKRYPSAAALAALAIEEAGKSTVLRAIALARTQKEWHDEWKGYRSHTTKNAGWPAPVMIRDGARTLEDFRVLYAGTSGHPDQLDTLKQVGFYTDCVGACRWLIPEEQVNEATARYFVDIAERLAMREIVTTRELELWVEHVGPVWKTTLSEMKEGVAKWAAAMEAESVRGVSEQAMRAFLDMPEQ